MEVTIVISIISLISSIVAIVVSLLDTRLAIEYFFSNECILLKLKDNATYKNNKINHYISNCKFFGVNTTDWYYIEMCRDYESPTTLLGLDIDMKSCKFFDTFDMFENFDMIMITLKGKRYINKLQKEREEIM